MKRHMAILVVGFLFPLMVFSQTHKTLDPEFGGRLSVSVDKRIVQRLHVYFEEEIRFDNNFGSLERLQTTLAVAYKVHPNVKLGLGYVLINRYGVSHGSFSFPRHRFFAEVTGMLHYGYWNFSLKERFQMTCRTGEFNVYQNPRNAFTLKSRLKAQYKGFGKVQPYAFVEMRHYLNAPVVTADPDPFFERDEPGWFLAGFNGVYVNRLRGSLGVDVRMTRRSTLNAYFMGDYISDKVVNANASGTILKSYKQKTGFFGWIGAGYEFAF